MSTPLISARTPRGASSRRAGIDPAATDDVGAPAGDVARTCALVAGLPESVPGTTVDRRCGDGRQAISSGAQAVDGAGRGHR